jgi:hypothetical protein
MNKKTGLGWRALLEDLEGLLGEVQLLAWKVGLSCGGSPMLLLSTLHQQKRVPIGLYRQDARYQETWRGNKVYQTVGDADRFLKLNLSNFVTRKPSLSSSEPYLRSISLRVPARRVPNSHPLLDVPPACCINIASTAIIAVAHIHGYSS